MLELRPEVAAFAQAMEAQLRKHDVTKGRDGWKEDDPFDLVDRVFEEAEELKAVVKANRWSARHHAAILGEAADVANMAMMVADVHGFFDAALATPPPAPGDAARHVHKMVILAEHMSTSLAQLAAADGLVFCAVPGCTATPAGDAGEGGAVVSRDTCLRCGHTEKKHDMSFLGDCAAGGCSCKQFTPTEAQR